MDWAWPTDWDFLTSRWGKKFARWQDSTGDVECQIHSFQFVPSALRLRTTEQSNCLFNLSGRLSLFFPSLDFQKTFLRYSINIGLSEEEQISAPCALLLGIDFADLGRGTYFIWCSCDLEQRGVGPSGLFLPLCSQICYREKIGLKNREIGGGVRKLEVARVRLYTRQKYLFQSSDESHSSKEQFVKLLRERAGSHDSPL